MISVFELFKIGIGPSSSHTMGPMLAAAAFARGLTESWEIEVVERVRVELFGSLAWTGKGHGSDRAVILGLAGEHPATVDPNHAGSLITTVTDERVLTVAGRTIAFDLDTDMVFDLVTAAPVHPNTLAFSAFDGTGALLRHERWCSIGGGFVVPEDKVGQVVRTDSSWPYPFGSAAELLRIGQETGLSIAQIVLANECVVMPEARVKTDLSRIVEAMMACIDRGVSISGLLPGELKVRRRAAALYVDFKADKGSNRRSPHEIMDLVSLFAIAVNEENAAGGRVVTAPTNGAAGVVPAVLRYYTELCPDATTEGVLTFLLTATAIGALYKLNASISGAEVGCQGEVGVACSMAAAGLAAALGGSNAQIENAAEIGMEHHLGMTCDPIGGLVQIPCIERNAFGAIKAINAASLSLRGDGNHHVSLDKVIATMRQTGADMQSKYKETSLGGLAVSFPEC